MSKIASSRLKNKIGNTSFGALLTMSGKIYSAFISYITLVSIARILSVDDFGVFSFFMSLVMFFSVIGSVGSENVLLSLVSKQKEKGYTFYYRTILSVFSLILISSIIVILVLFLTQNLIGSLVNIPNYNALLYVVIWVIFLQSVIVYFRALNQAEFIFVKALVPENFIRPSILFLLVVISLIWGTSNLTYISFSYFLSFLITTVIVILWNIKIFKDLKIKEFSFDKEVLKLSPQFMSIQLLNQASSFIPIFLMGIFLTSDAIGIFRASQQTTILVSFILISVNMVFAPTISSLYNKNKLEELKDFYAKTTKWTFVLGGYISLLVILNAELVLNLFGSVYKEWSMVLIILAFGQLINASTGSSGYMLLMTKNQKIMIYLTLLQVIVVVALSLITVKFWGIYGIAFSVAFGITLLNVLQVSYVWIKLKVHSFTPQYFGTLITILLSAIVTWLVQFLITIANSILHAIIISIIFTLVFTITFIKIGLTKQEKRYGKGLVKLLIKMNK